jgi:hypothetical protein
MWTGPPPYVPRGIRPDLQVWPPRPALPTGPDDGSTQPFPAIRAEATLPRRPDAAAAQPAAPEEPAAAPERPRKLGVRIALAVGLLALAIGAPTVDGYFTYQERAEQHIIHTVPPGQSLAFKHVSWKAAVERIPPPEGARPVGPDRTWMQITATRTALDAEGAARSVDPVFELKDAGGRTWKTTIVNSDVPDERKDNKIGTAYTYEVVGLVPVTVADSVEAHIRPSVARRDDDRSISEVLQDKSPETANDVLRFQR